MRHSARAVVAFVMAAMVVVAASAQKDQKRDVTKLDPAEQQELQTLLELVDAAMTAPGPADIPFTWKPDFLKAQEGRTYVPFSLVIPADAIPPGPVALYLRVTPKGATAPEPAKEETKKDTKKDPKKPEPSRWVFEDLHFLDVRPAAAGQPMRISRAFAVPPGDYDVYLALKQRGPAPGKEGAQAKPPSGSGPEGAQTAAAPKATVQKQAVTVPDFWTSELTTSSVILAERVEPLAQAPSPEEQVTRPYTLGATEIVPSVDSSFTKKEEVSVIFLIYNPALNDGKRPDVTVEYSFHQKAADGTEKYFNRTNPTNFNAETLPPQFDIAAGHQLVAGQSVPLASFPEGEYRLEIKVTDKISNKSVTRNVNFTVAPA
jgi:hypothetical protein